MKHGVDMDGTLAFYEDFIAPDVIGEPIPVMVERVKRWLAAGDTVDVFTARVHPSHGGDADIARKAIEKWFFQIFGIVPKVTCEKDSDWDDMWDDSTVQVVKNTGERADGKTDVVTDGIGGFVCGEG